MHSGLANKLWVIGQAQGGGDNAQLFYVLVTHGTTDVHTYHSGRAIRHVVLDIKLRACYVTFLRLRHTSYSVLIESTGVILFVLDKLVKLRFVKL